MRGAGLYRQGSSSPPPAGPLAENKPTPKDEKKITERGWSKNSGYGEEFRRLREKEALVFLFGQKKNHHPTTNPICSQQLCRAAHSSG